MTPVDLVVKELLAQGVSPDTIFGSVAAAVIDALNLTTKIRDQELHTTISTSSDNMLVDRFVAAGAATWADVSATAGHIAPVEARKTAGVVYTPDVVARLLASKAITVETSSVLDPACGAGALLAAALEQLAPLHGVKKASAMLYGCDIDAVAVRRAHSVIALAAIGLGENEAVRPKLVVTDGLFTNWSKTFPSGVQTVLSNPPYIRFQHLTQEYRAKLAERYATMASGTANLYYAFMGLLDEVLSPTGSFAYITPNNFMTTASAATLRESFADTRLIEEIIDFGASTVFEALTYTAIVAGSRDDKREALSYKTATSPTTISPSVTIPYTKIGRSPWRFAGAKDAVVVDAMVKAGSTLGAIAEIRYGFATNRDNIFAITGTKTANNTYEAIYEGVCYEIEPAATKPFVKVSNVRTIAQLNKCVTRVIYPYKTTNGKITIWDEKFATKKYPKTMVYLNAVREELACRDKGNQTLYPAWYAWGRTQGMTAPGPKLISPLYAATPRFMVDKHPSRLLSNGCCISVKPDAATFITLQVLQLLLETAPVSQWLHATGRAISGGYTSLDKRSLEAIPVPALDRQRCEQLVQPMSKEQRNKLVSSWYGLV